jgi:predicted dehydrogenase
MIRFGVIGYGYWGPNLVRNFSNTPGARVHAVADREVSRIAAANAAYPDVRTTTDARDLIADPAVDAVVIATSSRSHFELALASLQAGKHTLVEKPLAETSAEAARLVEEAARRRLVLMVNHTFVYVDAVQQIRDIVASGAMGEVLCIDAVRTSLHRFHPETGVLWDLAVHDLAIVDTLVDDAPVEVSATGHSIEPGAPPDVAHITLLFGGRRIAHVHVNWLTAVKLRRTIVGGERSTVVYDDLEPIEKVRVYEGGPACTRDAAAIDALRADYRAGRVWAPRLPVGEALQAVAAHFVDCVESGRRPKTDGESGWRIVRWLEAAHQSLARRGEPVSLA